MTLRLRADFNGLSGDLLCLSHAERCRTPDGKEVEVTEGALAIALEPDPDREGDPMELFATGTIENAREEPACLGSRWVLPIVADGVGHRPPSSSDP